MTAIRTQCRVITPAEVDSLTLAAWRDLEQRASQPNAFLSPYFILPAAEFLAPDDQIMLVLVERVHIDTKQLIGIGTFSRSKPTQKIPFPHLSFYRSNHTFTTGLLLDRDFVELALREYVNFFKNSKYSQLGVGFYDLIANEANFNLMMDIAAENKLKWFEIDRVERPILIPGTDGHQPNQQSLSRTKNLKRRMNNLKKLGSVRWRVTDGNASFKPSIEKFLELEHMGWKGTAGGSFNSRAGHSDFFRAMTTHFMHAKQAFFTELLLDEQIISSTVNLISSNVGFAFKIAWHPGYEKYSPGLLNEMEMINSSSKEWRHLAYIDSCAPPGSYLENLWQDRKTVVSGVFATTKLAYCLASTREYLRSRKQKILRWAQSAHAALLWVLSSLFCNAYDIVPTCMS